MTAPPAVAGPTRSSQTPRPHSGGGRTARRDVFAQCDKCGVLVTARAIGTGTRARLTFASAAGVVTDPHRDRLDAARSAWAEAENDALRSGIRTTADRLRGEFRRLEAHRSAGPDYVHRTCGGRFHLFDTRRKADQ